MADSRIDRIYTPTYLTDLSVGFEMRDFIADIVAPRMRVNAPSGKYRIRGKNLGALRVANRAPGMIPNAIEPQWSSGLYMVEQYALRTRITDEERGANAQANLGGVDLDAEATNVVTEALMVEREWRVAQLFTTAANFPSGNVITKAGGSEWDTVYASTPQQVRTDLDLLITKAMASAQVGRSKISVIIPEPVFDAVVRYNTVFMQGIQYTQIGAVTEALVASLLGVKQVILATAQYNGALSGIERANGDPIIDYSGTYMWADNVWAGVIAPQGAMRNTPSFARTLTYTANTGGQERLVEVYRHADKGAKADWVSATEEEVEVITYNGGGALLKNASSVI